MFPSKLLIFFIVAFSEIGLSVESTAGNWVFVGSDLIRNSTHFYWMRTSDRALFSQNVGYADSTIQGFLTPGPLENVGGEIGLIKLPESSSVPIFTNLDRPGYYYQNKRKVFYRELVPIKPSMTRPDKLWYDAKQICTLPEGYQIEAMLNGVGAPHEHGLLARDQVGDLFLFPAIALNRRELSVETKKLPIKLSWPKDKPIKAIIFDHRDPLAVVPGSKGTVTLVKYSYQPEDFYFGVNVFGGKGRSSWKGCVGVSVNARLICGRTKLIGDSVTL